MIEYASRIVTQAGKEDSVGVTHRAHTRPEDSQDIHKGLKRSQPERPGREVFSEDHPQHNGDGICIGRTKDTP